MRYPPPLSKHSLFGSLPMARVWALLLALGTDLAVYNGTKLLTAQRFHYDLSCAVDARIPLFTPAVYIYVAAFAFWVIGYIVAVRHDRQGACRFLAADLLARLLCLALLLLLPTTTVRPAAPESGCGHWLLALVYRMDAPDNLFPSLHCVISWLCWCGVRGRKNIHAAWRWFSPVMAVLVCLSTLLTKQHVFWDVPAGILIAEVSWQLAKLRPVHAVYSRLLARLGEPEGSSDDPCRRAAR